MVLEHHIKITFGHVVIPDFVSRESAHAVQNHISDMFRQRCDVPGHDHHRQLP